jgi:glycosyltransferase involved in cell wall biosynthesis
MPEVASKPLVSVLVIVRNGERFLADAIESILHQEYSPFEIIVIDGQSTDRTAEIARSFEQVTYVRQIDTGVSSAYNLAITLAKGEIVAFLSHDDLWTPDKLRIQVGFLIEHPEIAYTTAKVRYFLEGGEICPPGFRRELLEGEHTAHIMETLVARRAVFDSVGLFNLELTTAEDVDWFARARDANIPAHVIHKVVLRKRVHGSNTSLTSTANDRNLLAVMRHSIARKRRHTPG